jgi:signal recognition particle receptor subunit beta
MPHIDKRSGDIVVRVVYDGAPEAGKTTNVVALLGTIPLQRRGALSSPETTGRRTEFFDWLDFAGGFVDGRRLRCQLVSVPGQPSLLHRRRYLLETADAVVFVADSSPGLVDVNRADLATLCRVLDRVGVKPPVGIILQANKQDLPGALSPPELLSALHAPEGTHTIAAVATSGSGVLETFVLATRMATDRVRALVLERELDTLHERDVSASSLHAAMVEQEQGPPVSTPGTPDAPPAPDPPVHRRENDREGARAYRLFRPDSLLAGHVWPSVRGRAFIASAITDGTFVVPERARDWGPAAPIEIRLASGWILHSSTRWLFDSESSARIALITTVRRCVTWPALVPEGRAFFIGPDEQGCRLWMLSPALASIADEVLQAVDGRDVVALASALRAARHATAALRDLGHEGLEQGSSGLARVDDRVVVLALGGPDDGGQAVAPDAHAVRIATTYAGDDSARRACLARALSEVD